MLAVESQVLLHGVLVYQHGTREVLGLHPLSAEWACPSRHGRNLSLMSVDDEAWLSTGQFFDSGLKGGTLEDLSVFAVQNFAFGTKGGTLAGQLLAGDHPFSPDVKGVTPETPQTATWEWMTFCLHARRVGLVLA
eukprot:2720304-Amphidinium_carterae.1